MDKELCNCGFPQSYPVPHKHDLTDRERRIIESLIEDIPNSIPRPDGYGLMVKQQLRDKWL